VAMLHLSNRQGTRVVSTQLQTPRRALSQKEPFQGALNGKIKGRKGKDALSVGDGGIGPWILKADILQKISKGGRGKEEKSGGQSQENQGVKTGPNKTILQGTVEWKDDIDTPV